MFDPDKLQQLRERFEAKLRSTPSGCRVWIGGKSQGGQRWCNSFYGSFWIDREYNTVRAHVFAAFLAGKISEPRLPPGLQLDHTCDEGTLCVDCTELVPGDINRRRGRAKGRRQKICEEIKKGVVFSAEP